ncbi:MAG TPA: four helix bundle protein [Phycisphaerales bacterium]|nr:four helix bundle protein [Phycisphaerales bacterium]
MPGGIKSYKDLKAWDWAFKLGLKVYRVTETFPDRERFGLTVQIRRCAVSVASNIAEGYGRGSLQDYTRFLKVARGSLYELETQLMFAKELRYLEYASYAEVKRLLDETERTLAGLIRSLERAFRA